MKTPPDLGKRRAERFDLALPASLALQDPEGQRKLVELLTKDVCAGGVFLETESPLPQGTLVDLSLTIPLDRIPGMQGKRSRIKAMGEVVRAQDGGMAVRFDVSYQLTPVLPRVLTYVAGQNRLQNELLAHFLEKEVGIRSLYGPIQALNPEFNAEPDTTYITILDYPNIRSLVPLTELETKVDIRGAQSLIALFNVEPNSDVGLKALKHGLRGVFFNDTDLETFFQGMRALSQGELWYPKEILAQREAIEAAEEAEEPVEDASLTRKEKEILAQVAAGNTNKEIADKLFISVHTVKTHLYHIFRKIGAGNRLQATLWAAKNLEV